MHRRYALVIVFANLDKILKLGFWEYLREISRGKLCFFQILSKERFCIKIKSLLFEITLLFNAYQLIIGAKRNTNETAICP